jgi:hypothetical protein
VIVQPVKTGFACRSQVEAQPNGGEHLDQIADQGHLFFIVRQGQALSVQFHMQVGDQLLAKPGLQGGLFGGGDAPVPVGVEPGALSGPAHRPP